MQSTLKVACLTALLLVLAMRPAVQGPTAVQSPSILAGDNPKTGSGTG